MAEEERSSSLPVPPKSPKPESPTTAHALDFNDEPQEQGAPSPPPGAPRQQESSDTRPPKPPRPLSPRQKAEITLKEAFPTIDASVVRAVLVASGWNVERAFHALLGMTDPNSQEELPDETPPPKPPRPSRNATSTTQRQLEADEMYARQLAEHYNSGSRGAPRRVWDENEHRYRQTREGYDSDDKEYSFFDDDFPVIRENIRKGFQDTQTKVNSWMQNIKKRFDGEDLDDIQASQGRQTPSSQQRQSEDLSRRSVEHERYDADHQLLSDDFASLELRDTEAPPPPPPRPLAKPNLSKTQSSSPDRRKVSFQEGPPTEIGNPRDAPEPVKQTPSTGGRSSKWQPLAAVEPSPVADNDPFSLGDSDDEKDTKAKEHNNDAEEEGKAKQDATVSEKATEDKSKSEGAGN